MKKLITETVQVLLPAWKPDSCSDRGCNRGAAALRCALLALLALGLFGGISQAQEPLKIEPSGWVSIPKALAVGGDETGKPRYHLVWRSGGLDLAETSVADDRLFIQAGTGYVGIGHNQPKAMLDVAGGILAKTLSVSGGTATTPSKLTVSGTGYFSGNVGIGTEPTANKLSVGGNANFSGNVGIGTSTPSPDYVLDVPGGTARFQKLLVGDYSLVGSKNNPFLRSDGASVVLNAAESGNLYLGYDQGGDIVLGRNGGNTWMHLKSKGGLDVHANSEIYGNLYVTGDTVIFDKGKWWRVREYYNNFPEVKRPSDVRLKTDLHPIPSALEKISQLRGVTFRWNEQGLQYLTRDVETTLSAGPGASDEENRKLWQAERDKQYRDLSTTNVGVLAQDVEAVLPQAVTTDASGYKLVNYTELIPLVIEALKEEDKISQEQARTIARQQTEIQRLTVANQAAQQQSIELQEVKQKLGLLEATVNNVLASGSSGDQRRLASAGEHPAANHPSGSE